MPSWLDITDSSRPRMEAGLQFIQEGRCVNYHGVGMAIHDGALLVYVAYSGLDGTRETTIAYRDIHNAKNVISHLFETVTDYAEVLSDFPRRYFIIQSDGKSDVEVAQLVDGELKWIGD